MKTIYLHIQAKHLIGADFNNNRDCAIARAFQEYLTINEIPFDIVSEGVDHLWYDKDGKDQFFSHECYFPSDFREDQKKAEKAPHPETIIRTLKLKPL